MTFLEHPAQMVKEIVPLGPTGYLLHKATLLRLEVTADLPNIETNTKRLPKWGDKETGPM